MSYGTPKGTIAPKPAASPVPGAPGGGGGGSTTINGADTDLSGVISAINGVAAGLSTRAVTDNMTTEREVRDVHVYPSNPYFWPREAGPAIINNLTIDTGALAVAEAPLTILGKVSIAGRFIIHDITTTGLYTRGA